MSNGHRYDASEEGLRSVETKGRLQLAGALVTGIELKSVHKHLDYIAVALKSDEFVGLLGSNRIRLVFLGCSQSGLDMCMVSGQDTLHSFYVKDNPSELDRSGCLRYCMEMSGSANTLEIIAKSVQVEISKTTHPHH